MDFSPLRLRWDCIQRQQTTLLFPTRPNLQTKIGLTVRLGYHSKLSSLSSSINWLLWLQIGCPVCYWKWTIFKFNEHCSWDHAWTHLNDDFRTLSVASSFRTLVKQGLQRNSQWGFNKTSTMNRLTMLRSTVQLLFRALIPLYYNGTMWRGADNPCPSPPLRCSFISAVPDCRPLGRQPDVRFDRKELASWLQCCPRLFYKAQTKRLMPTDQWLFLLANSISTCYHWTEYQLIQETFFRCA